MIPLDRNADQPLRDQIYTGVRAAILDGTLIVGARLPSTRELARHLGVSRLTVDDAYARLIAEEYTIGRRGSGTYVASDIRRPVPARASERHATTDVRGLSRWAGRLPPPESRPRHQAPLPFNLAAGTPALDVFPRAVWQRLQAREARNHTYDRFDYGPAAGLRSLRGELAGYVARSRGVRCSPDQVVITSSTHQSVDLLTRLMVDPGDAVVVEDPGYPAVRQILSVAGAAVSPLPVDADGLRTDLLPTIPGSAKLACVTPSHQYPSGALLPLARRLELLRWAGESGALVLEDDYDSELRYDARPLPALSALASGGDGLGRVAYLGTFSKVLFPALRIGYVVLDSDLVDLFVDAKRIVDRHPATQLQATAAAFIAEGHFERHLVRMRRLYASRQATLIAAIDTDLKGIASRNMFGGSGASVASAGLHVMVRVEGDRDERDLIARAADHCVEVSGGNDCFVTEPAQPHLLLGYAAMPEARIEEAVRRLASALRR